MNGTAIINNATYYTSYGTAYVGKLKNYRRNNGSIVSFTYNANGQANTINYPLFTLDYGYDSRGNVSSLTGPWTGQTFAYDKLNRIVYFRGSWGIGRYKYVSSNSDDRLSKTIGSDLTEYAYDNGRLKSESVNGVLKRSYKYIHGDAVRQGGLQLEYDPYHNLIQSKTSSAILGEYRYNASNKRVYKSAKGETTLYFYGKDNEILSETDENGESLADYIYLNGKMVARITPN